MVSYQISLRLMVGMECCNVLCKVSMLGGALTGTASKT